MELLSKPFHALLSITTPLLQGRPNGGRCEDRVPGTAISQAFQRPLLGRWWRSPEWSRRTRRRVSYAVPPTSMLPGKAMVPIIDAVSTTRRVESVANWPELGTSFIPTVRFFVTHPVQRNLFLCSYHMNYLPTESFGGPPRRGGMRKKYACCVNMQQCNAFDALCISVYSGVGQIPESVTVLVQRIILISQDQRTHSSKPLLPPSLFYLGGRTSNFLNQNFPPMA